MEFYAAIEKNDMSAYDMKSSPRPPGYFNKWKRAGYRIFPYRWKLKTGSDLTNGESGLQERDDTVTFSSFYIAWISHHIFFKLQAMESKETWTLFRIHVFFTSIYCLKLINILNFPFIKKHSWHTILY